MRLNVLFASAIILLAGALPASAQVSAKSLPVNILSESIARAATDAAGVEDSVAFPLRALPPATAQALQGGGKTLSLLQAGMVALQAMDVVSTRQALSRPGAYETNPALGGGSLPATIAVKAGATAGIILLTNHIAKTNRVAAIATMVALNSAYATIAARNFAIAHGR